MDDLITVSEVETSKDDEMAEKILDHPYYQLIAHTKALEQLFEANPGLDIALDEVLEAVKHFKSQAHGSDGIPQSFINASLPAGFRTGHITQTTLLKLTDEIITGANRKLSTILILFDFSKAFNSVCHVSLLLKLKGYGFATSVIKWMASYRMGRKQAVQDRDNSHSTFRYLNTGVPQGSVLGPLLFALYITTSLAI
ncbi:hypothetical protein TSAR_007545 [Trichomalopsis sarcophagae]|uniref:Reverse transcriptase domain-containing protein n=1 Tax=Trichomalopsis sarcophagae TaxID=543379 RepID=A0A232ESY6_9HYME|nr:hypothetical protein TSAR_007545 [Trichomalopsis sarcophagae]